MTLTVRTINIPAVNARVPTPNGITIDSTGNLYFTDKNNHRILKSTLGENGSWTTTVYAGTGSDGNIDGPVATSTFYAPSAIVTNSIGNMYVSNMSVHTIRFINTYNNVSTILGTAAGQMGDVPNSNILGSTGDTSTARIKWPKSMAIDVYNNIFVIDSGNYCVRKIITTMDSPYTVITFANGFNIPQSIACDSEGNVYVTDIGAYCIYKIPPGGGTSDEPRGKVIAGTKDSRGTSPTQLFRPSGICIVGIIGYVFDKGQESLPNGGGVIRTFNINTTTLPALLRSVAGNGSAGDSDGNGTANSKFRFTDDNTMINGFTINKTTNTIYVIENAGYTGAYNGNRIRSMKLSNRDGTAIDTQVSSILTNVCSS